MSELVSAYYARRPDPSVPEQRVAFGTSGHRGSSLDTTFNEGHVYAIAQAICLYRAAHQVDGPLFLGIDTHALSQPALTSTLEVLADNGVDVMLAANDEYTPTPAVSHAILSTKRPLASSGSWMACSTAQRDSAAKKALARRSCELGDPQYERVEAPATPAGKAALQRLSPGAIRSHELAGEAIQTVLTNAPGNGAPLDGVTESIYKIYAESFRDADHLRRILADAQVIVDAALASAP